ncbi:hypothetical protein N9L68_07700 [bacterium]|nr:hypothetical protein [bacterium]
MPQGQITARLHPASSGLVAFASNETMRSPPECPPRSAATNSASRVEGWVLCRVPLSHFWQQEKMRGHTRARNVPAMDLAACVQLVMTESQEDAKDRFEVPSSLHHPQKL